MANTVLKELKYENKKIVVECARRDGSGNNISTTYSLKSDLTATNKTINSHLSNKNNPHSVTKAQVGLSNVDNTSDANKPISTATQNALNEKADKKSLELKQDKLTSGSNIKTINGQSIVGSGNVTISASVPTADKNTAGIYKVMKYSPVNASNWNTDDIVLTGQALKWVVENATSFPLKTINGNKITGTGDVSITASLPSDAARYSNTNGSFPVGSADWGRVNIGTTSSKIGIFMRSMQLAKGESNTTSCSFSSVNFTHTPLVIISETTSGNTNSATYRNNALVSSVTTTGCYIKSGKNNDAPYINILAIGFAS